MNATADRPASAGEGEVVTRFAPSPTGFLHIGGARTALFNWLYARRTGGKFLLRIEDTDRARSTDAAVEAILDGMRWLGLDWDGDATFQFARAGRHAEVAQQLLDAGYAYRCYLTQEELASMRERASAEKRAFRVDSPYRDGAAPPSPDAPSVVRLKAPRDGNITINDRVQGEVSVSASEIDDFVLLRSDGTPTYMLSVVVDDEDMGVTHVIRGDDHFSNAFRQLALLRALGWREPVYAHVPMIHGSDGAKLSKRHGAMGVDAYRDELGMLPEAVGNYLLRLGWGHGDDEIITREDAVRWFDIDDVGRSPSRFDLRKLDSVNAHYLRAAEPGRLAELIVGRAEKAGAPLPADALAKLTDAMPVLTPRATNLNDVGKGAAFLFASVPLDFDEKAQSLLAAAPEGVLASAQEALTSLPDWSAEAVEAAVRGVAERAELGLGKVAQPLRAALTGRAESPGIFDVLLLLGRDESLHRIAAALSR